MLSLFKKNNPDNKVYDYDLVGCLGKLPIHREFIKHKLILPELARLDQWYQSAYSSLSHTYGKAIKNLFSQMPPYHYIYYAHGKMLPMVGMVMASHDQSGRVYPFTIFRTLENPLAQEFHSAIPIIYSAYFNSLQTFADSISQQILTLPQLFTHIATLNKTATQPSRHQILESTVTTLNTITLNNYWQEITTPYPNLQLPAFTQTVLNALNILKTQLPKNSWGIRFPATSNPISITFWLQLIETACPKQELLVQVFWNHNSATIFFKPMLPEYFASLVDPKTSSPYLFDVIAECKTTERISALAKENHIDKSLLDVLQKWSQ